MATENFKDFSSDKWTPENASLFKVFSKGIGCSAVVCTDYNMNARYFFKGFGIEFSIDNDMSDIYFNAHFSKIDEENGLYLPVVNGGDLELMSTLRAHSASTEEFHDLRFEINRMSALFDQFLSDTFNLRGVVFSNKHGILNDTNILGVVRLGSKRYMDAKDYIKSL